MQVAWIETFLMIVERGGFSAAADALFRSQSRVSAHIASLERELGATLLDRRQRPVSMTRAGRAFYDYAAAVKSSVDAGVAAVRAVEDSNGRLALGTFTATATTFLPPLLADFAERHPSNSVEIVERPADLLDTALVHGEIPMAIRPRLPRFDKDDLSRAPLWLERMLILAPRDHTFAQRAEVSIHELRDEKVIGNSEAAAMLRQASIEPELALESDQPLTILSFVARGLGVALINELGVQGLQLTDVVAVELSEAVYRIVDICWMGSIDPESIEGELFEAIRTADIPAGTLPPNSTVDLTQFAQDRH